MNIRTSSQSFQPVYNSQSQVLILGSYPSPKSVEAGFYYYHPRNRFWSVLAQLFSLEVPNSVVEKKQLLLAHKIALWDVIESCEIDGAKDHSIKNEKLANIGWLLNNTKINIVFCNGAAAYKLYNKFLKEITSLNAQLLPSTSPANATYSLQKLVVAWKPLKDAVEYS